MSNRKCITYSETNLTTSTIDTAPVFAIDNNWLALTGTVLTTMLASAGTLQ